MKTKPVVKKTAPKGGKTQGEKFEFLYYRYMEKKWQLFYMIGATAALSYVIYIIFIEKGSEIVAFILNLMPYILGIQFVIYLSYIIYISILKKEKTKRGYGVLHENHVELYINKTKHIIKYQEIEDVYIVHGRLGVTFIIYIRDEPNIKFGLQRHTKKEIKNSYEPLKALKKAIMKKVKEQNQIKANRK